LEVEHSEEFDLNLLGLQTKLAKSMKDPHVQTLKWDKGKKKSNMVVLEIDLTEGNSAIDLYGVEFNDILDMKNCIETRQANKPLI
jgi:hypothetical protein